MQIPILSGIYTDGTPDFRVAFPMNMEPVPKDTGLSRGYLRSVPGVKEITSNGPGVSRGGIFWRGSLYRVMGRKLVQITPAGKITELMDVGGSGPVSMAYSFNHLAICSNQRIYYWDGQSQSQIDPKDLGAVIDVVWSDGYFVFTDGTSIIATELTDITSINPLRYASAEFDPDPVVAVKVVSGELVAIGRYTLETFSNVGGSGFPFQVVTGAQSERGAVGTHACVVVDGALFFVGGGRNEPLGVYVGANGATSKISTDEIDKEFARFSEQEMQSVEMESVKRDGRQLVYIHLPDKSLCYDLTSTATGGVPVWCALSDGVSADQALSMRHHIWAYDQWNVGHASVASIGTLSSDISTRWGQYVRWQFHSPLVYGGGNQGVIHSVELVGLPGASPMGANAQISAEWSVDGLTWSQPRWVRAGKPGQRDARLRWMRQGVVRDRRMYRFTGGSMSPIAIALMNADVEASAW